MQCASPLHRASPVGLHPTRKQRLGVYTNRFVHLPCDATFLKYLLFYQESDIELLWISVSIGLSFEQRGKT